MKVDLSQPILELDGSVSMIPDGSGVEGQLKPLDLGTACIRALFTPSRDDETKDTPEAKQKRFAVGVLLGKGGTVSLTVEEAALIVSRAWVVYMTPLVPGRIQELLDPKD